MGTSQKLSWLGSVLYVPWYGVGQWGEGGVGASAGASSVGISNNKKKRGWHTLLLLSLLMGRATVLVVSSW